MFLADKVLVLSGRPATTQFEQEVTLPEDRGLDVLYTPEATTMLASLREQNRHRPREKLTCPSNLRAVLIPILFIVGFLIFWEWIVWANNWPNYKMASPSDLWPAFWKFKGLFVQYGWDTLWRTVVGLLLSVIVGTFLGMIMGLSKVAYEGLYPLLVGFNAIPKATVVPVVALIFVGSHDFNTILIAFMISFFSHRSVCGVGLVHPRARIFGQFCARWAQIASLCFGKSRCPKRCRSFLAR